MPNQGMIGQIVEVYGFSADMLMIEWRINEVSSLSSRRSDFYTSPGFLFQSERWTMSLCLNYPVAGLHPEAEGVRLCLYRHNDQEDPSDTLNASVGIKGSRTLHRERAVSWEFVEEYGFRGFTDFGLRSELMKQESRIMPNGLLTIICIMRSNVHLAASGDSSQLDTSIETEVKQSSIKRGGEKANEDLAKLLISGENSDMTFHVGEVEIRAHRAILSARSPVLSAMFQHPTSERATNRIVIEDCESDIFKDFLHYIYSGSVQLFTEENVFNLYRVADKYMAEDLKLQCLEYLGDTLSVQSFCETVKIALVHKENGLLKRAFDFASKNVRLIIRTSEWQNLIREFPTESTEILIHALGPPSQN